MGTKAVNFLGGVPSCIFAFWIDWTFFLSPQPSDSYPWLLVCTRMVLVSIVCLLSDHCRVNVTLFVVHVYMFISRFYWHEQYICAWPNAFREVWFVSTYAFSFSGVRIDFFISKHLDSTLLTFACFYPSLISHDLAWFTICTLTFCS